jgi:hypothetical protein
MSCLAFLSILTKNLKSGDTMLAFEPQKSL